MPGKLWKPGVLSQFPAPRHHSAHLEMHLAVDLRFEPGVAHGTDEGRGARRAWVDR